MKKSFNGYEASFQIKYTETQKIISFSVLQGFGFSTSWEDALETIRRWTDDWALLESLDDDTYEKIALAYAIESNYIAKAVGRRWIVYSGSDEIVQVSPLSAYENDRDVLVAWAGQRMDVDFIRSQIA